MKIFSSLFFLIYRYILAPMSVVFLLMLAPFHQKLSAGLRLRRNLKPRPRIENPIWIHASSGEFEYAKSVIRKIKERAPNTPILVTYFSPSYQKQIESFPGVTYCEPLPLDLPGPIQSFLKHYQPKCLLISRTDIWPEVMNSCAQRKIPVLLFATTFRPLTGLRALLKPFFVFLFQNANQVFCVSRFDVENLKGVTASTEAGDTRYDQVEFRLRQPSKLKSDLFSQSDNRLLLVAGSTWPQDEKHIFSAVEELIKNKKLRLVIAPHEPTKTHLDPILDFCSHNHFSYQLLSQTEIFNSDCLIVDQVGVLAELYTQADITFVGGSFRSKVHSVMEPLGAHKPVLVGPFISNNREATEFSFLKSRVGISPVTSVQNSDELKSQIVQFIQNRDAITELNQFIEIEFQKRLGSTEKVIEWLSPYLTYSTKGNHV